MKPSKRHDAPHGEDKSHDADKPRTPAVPPEKREEESDEENEGGIVREDEDA